MHRKIPFLVAACSAFFSFNATLAQQNDAPTPSYEATAASSSGLSPNLSPEERAAWNGTIFRIEDSRSRVQIASVNLSVSDLKPVGNNLVGEYTIEVPLMKTKNDRGRIVLPLNQTMEQLGSTGGVLRGQAISYKEGTTPNLIKCVIIPNESQDIRLEIVTDDRTLKFESRYQIVEAGKGS